MADCGAVDLICKGKELVGGAVGNAVQSGANNLGDIMMAAWDSMMKSFLTSWLDVGLMVNLDTGSVPWLAKQLHVFSVFFAVIGVMIACIWTMLHARGDKAIQVSKSLFRVFLVTTLGTVLIQVVLSAGDSFSTWVLDSAGVSAAGYKELGATAALNPGLAIIAGIFGVIATLIQWGIMMVRAVVLPLLVAVWPLSAAASMVQGGEESFSKVTKWLLAFLLYKPVAAVIYAFAWKLKSGEDGVGGVISGMLLLVLAVAALPALMKLVAPGTSALGGMSGGGMAMAAGAAVVSAGVAVGAAVATGGASGAAGVGASAGTAGKTASTAAPAASSPTTATGNTAMASNPAPSADAGSSAAGSGDSGSSGSSGSAGAIGDSGDSGPSGSDAEGGGNSAPAPTGGSSAGGSSRGGSGLQAGAESIGGTVAQGGKDSDGKDVIGE